jgi:hypothetical protein
MKLKFIGIASLLAASIVLLSAVPVRAQYSDYYWNKRQAEVSRDLTLKYGGTYSGAATNYMNRRYGYPKYPHTSRPHHRNHRQLSHQERQELNRLIQRTDSTIRYYNSPEFWRRIGY